MTENRPIVSVVMAAYKTKQEFFCEAIKSILGQTLQDFEFIIVDDGLSEENRSYLTSLQDERLKVLVNERNVGQSISVNRGIHIAQGKYIARMDSDDIALPNRLASQVYYMESHPECIACGGFAEGTNNHRIGPNNYPDSRSRKVGFFFGCDMVHPTMMLRHDALDKYGIRYDEDQLYAQDYMIWIDLMRKGEIGIVDEIVLRRRVHAAQITYSKRESQDQYAIRAQKKLFKEYGFNTEIIDFALHFRFVAYDLNVPLSNILKHLRDLAAQAKSCLSPSEARLFIKELDFRAFKASAREIVRRGNIFNGVVLFAFYGMRPCNWKYYVVRAIPARPR